MRLARNLFAIFGVLCLLAIGYGAARLAPILATFDPGAPRVYAEFGQRLLATGDPGMAMMWSVPVEEGLATEDVVDSLKSLAVSNNLLFVGESPFYQQIEAITGEPYRYVNFLSFCDARVGRQMLEHRNEYSGFMPCRIALVEDAEGRLHLYSMNLDLLIHGGRPLPPELEQSATRVRDIIWSIMQGAAVGEF
ncbi:MULTISPECIES: DUF302 domain-containing protein [Marichromatium]|uniref:Uncharacterized protein (DUF302 family) n=1 Tax=Marichromatium gracile TaxID=1048 RepID=A0A4R4A6P0_MARGR|nr:MULTISPECIES: DUF302 domain-containing protein [Marichromatium]MBO8084692.1 DUF302 domain-containing protein [Marichromatium sp.]MBK1708589.1 hypothetical protein [Marichromatium gracile]RNE89193.1 DUF302 domain-containing protein [Marichromatium sp. AB31]RNE93536.1 DUF302 domain-containing protein [Marichromatium sp. AB32]TCW34482.1 uncharacterized protein (DUF302 family) [Marichromatium gracile]